ncbi:auxin-responsive protein SAUR68-like [Asparagus officinalis]|uniref:auxin-responsive protein SAUR68-like n=1 Tax=Asparagus officinalis TaxID=4686 RepID=UPI00098DF349|nr:auxin-responsive protein SAUR68-like [Asparagus officinalis]XP_020272243.1 auxin-responsive protein SAUR68-like [Asparagus officinalis]XP_020272245.1 auxin-responsive protein SAUR68-like [Asparagus officinalis]
MVNSKKIVEMARKWRKAAALGKRVSSTQADAKLDSNACSTPVAEKGHFIVYTSDAKRFMVPLRFLESIIFVELLKMSEDEHGLPSDGPIILPCDAVFMEYILSLLRRRGSKAMDRVLLDTVFRHRHSPCSSQTVGLNQQVVCSF